MSVLAGGKTGWIGGMFGAYARGREGRVERGWARSCGNEVV